MNEVNKTAEGNIIWLASYPKSGNTWTRIFLNNLLSEQEEPIDINDLHETGSISSARNLFDELVGVDSGDFRPDEIDYYLPRVHRLRSEQLEEKEFIKSHNAFTKNKNGEWLIPIEATYKAIYLVRNPLDVCVSFAHHSGHTDFDKTIEQMAKSNMTLASSHKRQNNQLHQYMGSWSDHYESWQNVPAGKLLVVRYEDMKLHTLETFTKIVKFADLPHSSEEIAAALEKSSIGRLQKMEEEKGFLEKTQKANRFFRKGIIGSWQKELSEEQAHKIIQDHTTVMIKLGYLNKDGTLNF